MRTGKLARGVVYPAIFGALALVVLYLAAVSPAGAWGLAAVAGLFPMAVVMSVGMTAGLVCWAGVSLLAFLLLPDKFIALLFGALFGLYPIVKGAVERLRKLPVEYLLKLAFFNGALTVVFLTMKAAVLESLPAPLGAVWALYLAGNAAFLVYDFGLTKLVALYMERVHRHFKG